MPRPTIAPIDAGLPASIRPEDRGRAPFLRLILRLALAAAMIAGISLYALSAHRPKTSGGTADRMAEAAPLVPATVATRGPPAPTPARLLLDDPAADPVRPEAVSVDSESDLREDVVTRGAFEAFETPALRLTLSRGPGAGRAPGLFVLLARRAAVPGLAVVRTGAYGRLATKFGAVETLEATLSGPVRRACTAFVTRESDLRIDGWLCAPLGRPPEPRALACTIDALVLHDPADAAASAAFRAAEARREPGCERAAAADPAGRTGSIAGRRLTKK